MNYREFNDNELLNYIAEANEEANEIIYEKYKPLISKIAKKFYDANCNNCGLELNDLIQEGMLGLNSAINHYNENKDIMFYTFAKTCIERRIISAIISSKRLKHKILNDSISLEINQNDSCVNLEYLFSDSDFNPETIVIDIDEQKNLITKTKERLTSLENQVFELKLDGFEYKEIAKLLEKSPKAIDNTIQRIKIKIKQIMDENNN